MHYFCTFSALSPSTLITVVTEFLLCLSSYCYSDDFSRSFAFYLARKFLEESLSICLKNFLTPENVLDILLNISPARPLTQLLLINSTCQFKIASNCSLLICLGFFGINESFFKKKCKKSNKNCFQDHQPRTFSTNNLEDSLTVFPTLCLKFFQNLKHRFL